MAAAVPASAGDATEIVVNGVASGRCDCGNSNAAAAAAVAEPCISCDSDREHDCDGDGDGDGDCELGDDRGGDWERERDCNGELLRGARNCDCGSWRNWDCEGCV